MKSLHWQEISYCDPLPIVNLFKNDPFTIFLDSALTERESGRYSFIAVDPFLALTSKNGSIQIDQQTIHGNPFHILREYLDKFPIPRHPDLPPFQTGVAGYFAYDLNQHLESVPPPEKDDMQFPDMALGFYDVVIAFDHAERQAWILSSGYPEQDGAARNQRALERLHEIKMRIQSAPESIPTPEIQKTSTSIYSNFSRAAYEQAVQTVIDYIYAGDIFQANISQRFHATLPQGDTPFTLFQRLRTTNPAPFSAYLNFGDTVIVSASPERFLLLTDKAVQTRPIKGTRPRGDTPEQDIGLAQELLDSEKDNAENIIIVDLLRNDLSKVCEPHSVKTPELCILESYATVHHLVSTVTGELKSTANAIDLLQATIPGGSITGAPKVRAMEIIAELEPTSRGPYCGNIGYISFNGDMDTSIAIRTYAIKDNMVTFQAGGGIVADSIPNSEYLETIDKAQALIDAFGNVDLKI